MNFKFRNIDALSMQVSDFLTLSQLFLQYTFTMYTNSKITMFIHTCLFINKRGENSGCLNQLPEEVSKFCCLVLHSPPFLEQDIRFPWQPAIQSFSQLQISSAVGGLGGWEIGGDVVRGGG